MSRMNRNRAASYCPCSKLSRFLVILIWKGGSLLLNEPNRSIGKFNVNQSGVLVDLAGSPIIAGQIDTEFALEGCLGRVRDYRTIGRFR